MSAADFREIIEGRRDARPHTPKKRFRGRGEASDTASVWTVPSNNQTATMADVSVPKPNPKPTKPKPTKPKPTAKQGNSYYDVWQHAPLCLEDTVYCKVVVRHIDFTCEKEQHRLVCNEISHYNMSGDDAAAATIVSAASADTDAADRGKEKRKDGSGGCCCCCRVDRAGITVLLLAATISFGGAFWGFISFSATTLNDEEGLSFTQIGTFVPTFGVNNFIAVAAIGSLGERVHPKILILTGLAVQIGGHVCFLTSVYWIQLVGMGLIGWGYTVLSILPFPQIKLLFSTDRPRYDKYFFLYEFCSQVVSAAGGRLFMMISVNWIHGRRGWQLPWAVSVLWMGVMWLLLLFFGKFVRMPNSKKKREEKDSSGESSKGHGDENITSQQGNASVGLINAAKAEDDHKGDMRDADEELGGGQEGRTRYVDKLKALYMDPVALFFLIGTTLSMYCFFSVAAWAPTFAERRFEDKDKTEVRGTMTLAVLIAMPGGVILTGAVLRKANHIVSAARVAFLFVFVGVGVVIGYTYIEQLEASMAVMCVYLVIVFFPMVFYKQIPDLVQARPQFKLFILSRFELGKRIAGDVCSTFLTGWLLDNHSVKYTLTIVVFVQSAAALVWFVPFVWTCMARHGDRSGPIADIMKREKYAKKVMADDRWSMLVAALYARLRWRDVLRNAMFTLPACNHYDANCVNAGTGIAMTESSTDGAGKTRLYQATRKVVEQLRDDGTTTNEGDDGSAKDTVASSAAVEQASGSQSA